MTIARGHLVDASVTRWYRYVTHCVRRDFLLAEGVHDRKGLSNICSRNLLKSSPLALARFAVLDNHLHVLVLSTRLWPSSIPRIPWHTLATHSPSQFGVS